ncbi:hypothetical protein ABZ468_51195 [Streptomyces sp. NPDC005708]|uniref:hypothetical protein n=1 Tax=unclassified Streptomyces TaxID=2593676 RepID=UPI003404578E
MSLTPHAPRTARRCAWVRVLVVLVALLAAGAHTGAVAAPSVTASVGQACDGEYDVPASALGGVRSQRTVASSRPGPRPGPRPHGAGGFPPAPTRQGHSPALGALRTVVLRC